MTTPDTLRARASRAIDRLAVAQEDLLDLVHDINPNLVGWPWQSVLAWLDTVVSHPDCPPELAAAHDAWTRRSESVAAARKAFLRRARRSMPYTAAMAALQELRP